MRSASSRRFKAKTFVVDSIERKEKRRNPVAPFITSRLQQEAARKLHFSPKKTMTLAQKLYEGIEIGAEGQTGLITYMRTDSPRISNEAMAEARQVHPGTVRRRILACHTERVQDAESGARSARSDSPHGSGARPRVDQTVPGARYL